MKKLLFVAALLLAALSPRAVEASGQSIEVGYSTWAVRGVFCTTGTVKDLTEDLPTGWQGRVAGYRIQNQDSADDTWLGGPTVSTGTTLSAAQLLVLGEKLIPGANVIYHLGYDNVIAGMPRKRVSCRAADAAGSGGVLMSVAFFGY